jgi:transglutaminase-like putative cysteine protease
MRLRVAHSTICRYEPPATGAIQLLRLTPRNYEGQYVVHWRIDVAPDARLSAHEDAFGNITHVFAADGPLAEWRIEVDGEVETQNTDGVVRGSVERFPPSLFLRDTALTQPDAAIGEFAQAIRSATGGEVLAELHALLQRLHTELVYEPNRTGDATTTSAAETFARKGGAATDLTHIFIAAAHTLGIPTRFVAGYFHGAGEPIEQSGHAQSGHAWAESCVPGLGWVGFDPANGFCPTDAHLRVAIGLDALGAAPLRGARYGVGSETREIAIRFDQ